MANRWKRIGLIAGGGDLPLLVAEACVETGQPFFIAGIEGFMDPRLAQFEHDMFGFGELGRRYATLKQAGCDAVTFVGTIRRPDFSKLKLDLRAAALMPKVIAAAGRGDDALLRVMVEAFEKEGFAVVGAEEVAQTLLAPAGPLGRHQPSAEDMSDLTKARELAGVIGAQDIGQGVVVCRGLVLAVEAAEGTAQMLGRIPDLPVEIRGTSDRKAGVLFKRPKPNQENRIDLPTIGPETIQQLVLAGLSGVAVEAKASLILNREAVIQAADAAGVFVFGYAEDAPQS
jgi:UDP-2,3-diacylglucosamine hydrolase